MRFIFRQGKPVTHYRPFMARMDMAKKGHLAAGIVVKDVETPIHGRWLHNNTVSTTQIVLYLHGGAFSFRLEHGHTALVSEICAVSGASAFMPWYRLAPEHPFPAGPEDCLLAYRWLLDSGYKPENIVIMGDSAGGNLALSLLHLIKRDLLAMPSGVIALSPITDSAQISGTWRLNKQLDPMYSAQSVVNPAQWYFAGHNPLDPVLSPYYGDFSGFPPLYFLVGSVEALLEDSVGMVRKAIESGIPAKVQIWVGMPHVFPLQTILPEARYALQEIASWLAELKANDRQVPRESLYKSCVEVCDMKPFSHRVVRETNNVFLRD